MTAVPAQAAATGTSYDEATQKVALEVGELARSEGSFRAALPWTLDLGLAPGDKADKDENADASKAALAVSSDAQGRALLEIWRTSDGKLTQRDTAPLLTAATGCSIGSAALTRLGGKQVLATLELACASDPGVPPAAAGDPPDPSAPPAPESVRRERHLIVLTVDGSLRTLVHLASLPPAGPDDALTLGLTVESLDQDNDGYPDVRADAELTLQGEALHVPLIWLDRPSGLSRERAEPEASLATLADQARQQAARDLMAALPLAERVLAAHRALCQESGSARLLVDDSVGLQCGPSAAAGRAAVVRALALAKKQQLIPALAANAQLDLPAYKVDKADREKVAAALATIRGQTSFSWQRGPALSAPSAPKVRMPALGFAAEEQLLLRGPTAQSFDLRTRQVAPTSVTSGVVMSDPGGRYAIVDLVADCAGRYLRVVPASSVVSGYVAATSGKDVSVGEGQDNRPGCSQRTRRSDAGGFVVLGLSPQGALIAQGASVRVVPLDPQGGSGAPPRELSGREQAPPLVTPGGLSANGLRHALATSEGVVLIERGAAEPSTTLIRSPASCTGRISDVALSPSGQRVAMLCNGTVYWAEPTPTASASAGLQ